MSGGTMELATAYFQMVPSMAGAEAAISSELAPASAIAGSKAGAGIGAMLLGGLKKYAGPIALLAAGFSIEKIIKGSTEAFDGLASSTHDLQLRIGGTAAEVSGLSGALKLAGLDTPQQALTIFSKNLGNASADSKKTAAMVKELGVNFQDASGQVKPLSDILPGLADKFKTMPDGANKTALAMKLFGRQGAQMIPFLDRGAAGIAELTKQAKSMGLVLDDQSVNNWYKAQLAAKQYSAAVTGTKAALGQALAPAMDAIANLGHQVMIPVLTAMTSGFLKMLPSIEAGAAHIDVFASTVGSAISGLISGFTKGTDVVGTSQSKFAAVGAAIYGVFAKIGDVVKPVLAAFKPLFAQLGPVFAALIPQVLSLFSALSPTQLIFKSLLPILPQLVKVAGQLGVTLGGALGKALSALLPPITSIISMLAKDLTKVIVMLLPLVTQFAKMFAGDLAKEIKQLMPVVAQIIRILGGVLGSTIKQLMPIVSMVAGVFGTVLKAVMPLVPALTPLVKAVLSLIAPLLQLIEPILKPLIQLFTAILKPILALVAPLIKLLVPILTVVAQVLTWIVQGIVAALTWFVGLVTGSKSVQKGIHDAWGSVMSFFGDMWKNIGKFFSDGVNGIVGFFSGLPKTIMNALSGAGTWLVDIGKNMIQGLINGAGSLLKNIGTFFLKIIPSWIVAPFKAALGIHSPSTVFAELGGNIAAGLMVGLTAGKPAITAQMQSLVTIPSAAAAVKAAVGIGGSAGAGAGAIYVQNPFTGEYLLAKAAQVAQSAISAYDASSTAIISGGLAR